MSRSLQKICCPTRNPFLWTVYVNDFVFFLKYVHPGQSWNSLENKTFCGGFKMNHFWFNFFFSNDY